jgi:putative transposase
MPRQPRIHVPGGFYHVTLRGNHRQDIFFLPADRITLNEIVAEVITRFQARVHAYCWMTNHVHILIQVGDAPLGRLMLRIASQYARRVQRRFHTTGHLFERRYHCVLVDADEYLLELLRYIHLNPVQAYIVTDPNEYPWSSHHAYLNKVTQPWVTTTFALSMLHSDPSLALIAYQRFINDSTAVAVFDSPYSQSNPNDSRVLGNDHFLSKMLIQSWRPKSQKTLDHLIDEACQQFGITLDQLQSSSCHRSLTRIRAWVAHEAVSSRIASLSLVARTLNRSESSLRESVQRHFNST